MRGHVRINSVFIGPAVRDAVARADADYTPVFISEVPALLRPGGRLALDAALVQVSPPDAHGWCSLGPSVDVLRAAVDHAPIVIAEVNARVPRTHGASSVHVSRLTALVRSDTPLATFHPEATDATRQRIAERIAELIEDGSTLQVGFGSIPEATLARVRDRRDLGIHSEWFSDGMMALIECGAANGARKPRWAGKAVASFILGSEALYRWADDNAALEMQPSDVTNNPALIAANPKMVAINSAISIDLTGQVNADSVGHRFYSGVGGQADFLRGAAQSDGGRAIVARPSTARGGTVSRVVGTLAPGAGVVTTRADVRFVVTEWGRVDLHGLSVRQRARALITLAHPRFRDALTAEAKALAYLA
jgi:acyl-CoA hydrolase